MSSLKPLHTFGLNHTAESISYLATPSDFQELVGLALNTDFILLGSGSNVVFLEDISIPVFINRFYGKTLEETNDAYIVKVNSGENWHEFVVWCLDHNINGFENLGLIPGTVGASPVQNIGAYGVEVERFIKEVEYLDLKTGNFETLLKNKCNFGYRDSIFKNELSKSSIITTVTFEVPKKWVPVTNYGELNAIINPNPLDIFNKVCEVRTNKLPDPTKLGNAGSFFKNPIIEKERVEILKQEFPELPSYPIDKNNVKVAAGWLIDQAGLKGTSFGEVGVNPAQALVLTNLNGKAKGHDLIQATQAIIKTVFNKFGINLEPEVRMFERSGETTISAQHEA